MILIFGVLRDLWLLSIVSSRRGAQFEILMLRSTQQNLAMADLPHFSEELQNACLNEAASRLQPSDPSLDTYSLLAPIAHEFALNQGLRRDPPVFVNPIHGICAMLGFWSVMFETFELFSEFKAWLDVNAVPLQSSLENSGEKVTQLDVRQ